MKAIIWSNESKMILADRESPVLKDGHSVKIKIRYSGICGTDLQVVKGADHSTKDIIRGHEAVGEVIETGKHVKNVKVGDRVIIDPNQYCGRCYYCRKGLTNFCEKEGGFAIAGVNCDGVFAEYFVCDERFVYVIPEYMSWLQAVLVEPAACIYNNIKAANIKPDDSVLVLGSGPMGAICEVICKKLSRLVVGVERDEYRRKFCRKHVDHMYSPEELTLDEIYRINDGRKFDVIFDTVGVLMEYAMGVASKNARIIPIAMNRHYSWSLHPFDLISQGIKLVGASEYNMLFIDTINMLKRFPEMQELVTGRYAFDDYKEAFDSILGFDMETKESKNLKEMKVVFENS